jgi:Tannase and feruloyl esterase
VANDLLPALEDWVENGVAPDRIVAAQTENGKVVRTRPVFPYPLEAKYKGTGDPNDAANFAAVGP